METKKKKRPMPPKGPGGTPASETKAAMAKAMAERKAITEIEYTLGCCYRLLRDMGHQPMVVCAMLNCLSAGFNLADIETAANKYGDI